MEVLERQWWRDETAGKMETTWCCCGGGVSEEDARCHGASWWPARHEGADAAWLQVYGGAAA